MLVNSYRFRRPRKLGPSMASTCRSGLSYPCNLEREIMALAPRFALPKISQRVTSIRPRSFGIMASASSYAKDNRCILSHESSQSIFESLRCTGSFSAATYLQHRAFSSTPIRPRDHHFDTLKFVQRLKEEGFTEEQAVAMMKVLSDVIEERYAGFNYDKGKCPRS